MQISVFGTGYVGLVTGVCFAEMGNEVLCADIDPVKIEKLKEGISPIYEPGLEDLILNNIKNKRVQFTTNLQESVEKSDLLFIAVGTPSAEDGSADLKYLLNVAQTIGQYINGYKVVVTKSTVPVGTHKKVRATIEKAQSARSKNFEFDIVSNPEFLREGAAIDDCLNPNRVVVGVETDKAAKTMARLYQPFLKTSGNPLIVMDPSSSEMTKYAANSMLATKISIMNEFSRLCEHVGADIESVRRGIGADHRIGPHFIHAGIGYGGSCFPKDVLAMIHTGREHGEKLHILEMVERTNEWQRERFYLNLKKQLGENLKNKTIAVWGIAFKPGTDDIREAPSLYLIKRLLQDGAHVRAYDPVAANNAKQELGPNANIQFFEDQYDTLESSDALAIITEWKSFREPNFNKIKTLLKKPIIFDGRNIFDPKHLKDLGFTYHSVGRQAVQ